MPKAEVATITGIRPSMKSACGISLLLAHTRVIEVRFNAALRQRVRDLFSVPTGGDIDNPELIRLFHMIEQGSLSHFVTLTRLDSQEDVRPVHVVHDHLWRSHAKPLGNLLAHLFR